MIFLGSGSAGNVTAVCFGQQLVLVDCGLSARETARRLASVGLEAANVSAILLTHEHGDHVRGVDVFVRRHAPECVVYGTGPTLRAAGIERERIAIKRGEAVSVAGIEVLPFATSHDAAQPVGYRLQARERAVGLATDTGVLTDEALEALADVDVLGIESNHCERMLERGPYPPHLKRRIASDSGHLSNSAAAEALTRLASDRLAHVIGVHRSTTNNTAPLALETLSARATSLGLSADVRVASQDRCCECGDGLVDGRHGGGTA